MPTIVLPTLILLDDVLPICTANLSPKRYSENFWIARKETMTLFTNFDWNLAIRLCWL